VNAASGSGTISISLTHSVDQGVKQISTRYDRFGRVSAVYSHSAVTDYSFGVSGSPLTEDGLRWEPEGSSSGELDHTPAPGNIVNYVLYQYDRMGDAIRVRQRLDDATWQSGSPKAAPQPHQVRTYFSYTVPSGTFAFTNAPSTDTGYEVTRRLDAVRYPGFTMADNATDDTGLTPPAHFNGVSMDYGTSGTIESTIGRVGTVVLRSDWPSSTYTGSESQLTRDLVRYSYVGVGTRAISDIVNRRRPERPDLRRRPLAFIHDTVWHYGGWDRFGRLRLQSWVTANTISTNSIRPWFEERLVHDLGGRRTSRDQERGNSLFTDDHWRATYDGLDRLTESLRGHMVSTTFTPAATSRAGRSTSWGTSRRCWQGRRPPPARRAATTPPTSCRASLPGQRPRTGTTTTPATCWW